ncbi:helix-turn-helix transcriptional regulator [Kiloniella laminariae]|uniref:helix-turn-helix transcriptional regulator n=1 Tax=Kiloniella laminariae TaxID=454162 RepID=UPI00037F18D5|nr:YafY family protein [Kiloniella laminariae]
MRRTDRLFQIIQTLRGARRPVTGAWLAEELEVSPRTVYRDIAELMAQNVPIRGEAGIGYILEQGYDMPPLMLTSSEIEAAVLGAQWVATRGDPELARSARDLISKINAAVPEELRPIVLESSVMAPDLLSLSQDIINMEVVRDWVRQGRKLKICYCDLQGRDSLRVIWPVAVAYFEATRVIAGWCELRQEFRHFRVDRIQSLDFLPEKFPGDRRQLFATWKKGEETKTGPRSE